MKQAQIQMPQSDGSTIPVIPFTAAEAYQKAIENYFNWFQSCLED